jgi:putative phosphoesterase
MKIGVLGDIHGNYHSLCKVIENMKLNNISNVIILGDIVIWGSEPQSCFEKIKELNPIVWIKGNTDDWFNTIDECFNPSDDRERRILDEYNRVKDQLTYDAINFIRNLPEKQELRINGKSILCVHGSDKKIDEPIGIMTSPEEIKEIFNRVDSDIMLCAHTHRPYIITGNDILIMNSGSVGLPIDRSIAEYGFLTIEDNNIEYGIRRVLV